jgi:TRAP-type C4-dicarboxylate transport system substrate-binding protein
MRGKVLLLVAAAIACSNAATAAEVTLKAISVFNEKTTYSVGIERFIDRVNEAGKGVIQINYIGGPKAMPPFEVGNALKNGVVDIANETGAFYTNLMPEADTWKLTQRPMSELRKNGGFDFMEKILEQKMNAMMLARVVDNNPFHLYLNKRITTPDLTGLKLRITAVYRDFFQSLGATVVQTAPGEVYTALDRGVVDGYGWPITGVFDLGWNEKTKYRVDPGFYSAEVSIMINKTAWDKLDDQQKAVLRKAADQGEAEAPAEFLALDTKETERQAAAGIETISFDPAVAKDYVKKAYEAGWAGNIRQSPETAPKIREFFSKPE